MKSCKDRGENLRVHFKNKRETAHAIRMLHLCEATQYSKDVMARNRCVPFTRFNGAVGSCAQAKEFETTKRRWPHKSCRFILDLLKNAESNADVKGLDVDSLAIEHIQVAAAKLRRRTYRAHGRMNPCMCSPCQIEIILTGKKRFESLKMNQKRKYPRRNLLAKSLRPHNPVDDSSLR